MNVGPACFGDGFEILPDAVSGVQVKAAKLAVAVQSVNVIALKDGGGYAAMQAFSVSWALTLALPDFFDGGDNCFRKPGWQCSG